MPYILPEEANLTNKPCTNPHRVNIVTCKDENINQFLAEIDGLELDIEINNSTIVEQLPTYIPILDFASSKFDRLPDEIVYVGLTLTDILKSCFKNKYGSIHQPETLSLRKDILKKSLSGKKVILFLTGEDTVIETVWYDRDTINFFNELKQMNFFAATGINFSLFADECAFAQALNLKKSLYSSYLIQKCGLNAIPHIYALNKHQVIRWNEWFLKNPQLSLFTINCQYQKSDYAINQLVQVITTILSTHKNLKVILQGFQTDHLHKLGSFFDRIIISDKLATKLASSNKRFFFDSENIILEAEFDLLTQKDELLFNNINARTNYLAALIRKSKL